MKNGEQRKYREFRGMAQMVSPWQPVEFRDSPFKFAHRGILQAKWLFCREFETPLHICVATSEGFKRMDDLENGYEISKSIGDELFLIFRDGGRPYSFSNVKVT